MTPNIILELVDRFERDEKKYKSDTYNEAQLRQDFLNPMFKELGWDVYHELPATFSHREVKVEVPVKLGNERGFLDYAFCVDGRAKFVVEAKKPWVDVSNNLDAAKQLRRYGWNQKLGLSILTNFREISIYDCTKKPASTDRAQDYRLKYFSYADLRKEENWKWIAERFSKSAVLGGFLDEFAAKKSGKRGSAQVDDSLLEEIDSWRADLAANIYKKNEGIEVDDLNYIIGKIIDRIIFLRVCEDRGIEPQETLLGLVQKGGVYPRLVEYFYKADERYNSGLFHFKDDPKRGSYPDLTTPLLKVDDVVLQGIVRGLYYPKSQFLFSEIPIEILGHVYEQFLGKVITLEGKGKRKSVEIDYKPEVRKAGGVYYTPTYIVDYIVKHTVGKLVEGKTPEEVSKLRVLDPACGSGSFLIGAYQFLLDWHLEQYTDSGRAGTPVLGGSGAPAAGAAAKKTPPSPPAKARGKREPIYDSGNGWRLTLEERKRILLNNVYGVDIDAQAVEVTKLSLLLKVLENASPAEIEDELSAKHHALPDLGENIKCGNSLVGPDIRKQFPDLSDEEIERINPFDWQTELKDVFKQGGFDAVIGNPPYGAEFNDAVKGYIRNRFVHQNYQPDSYLLFVEQSVTTLLKESGWYGMIYPNPWLTNILQRTIRKFVVENTEVQNLVHFNYKVWPKVTVDTEIVILRKKTPVKHCPIVLLAENASSLSESVNGNSRVNIVKHKQKTWKSLDGEPINIFLNEVGYDLRFKLSAHGQLLESIADINVGIKPYQVGKGKPPQTREQVTDRVYDAEKKLSADYRQYIRGSDIARFAIHPEEKRFLKFGVWLAEPRPAANFDAPQKIVMRQTGDKLVAALDENKYLCMNNLHVIVPRSPHVTEFLLGILNSTLLNWYYQSINPEAGEALAEVKKTNIARLPIRTINFKDKADKARHDKMVKLVERMLELNKKLPEQKTPVAREKMERQIAATDREIDELVYELYGLTPEEIAIVEGRPPLSPP